MRNSKKPTALTTGADAAIELAFAELKGYEPHTKEYAECLTQIERLAALRSSDKKEKKTVSADNLISVGGNLAGIGMILGYERTHVLASKALGFVLKSKL